MNKHLGYLLVVISILIGSIVGLQFFQYPENTSRVKEAVLGVNSRTFVQPTHQESQPLVTPTAIPEPDGIIPVTLIVPKLKINAAVEHVGLDNKNNMDVPKQAMNAGWYSLGYKPGEKGNAVIAGHLDRKNGSPAIFYNLSKLVIGDTFSVVDENGKKLDFRVTGKRTYNTNAFPIETVFGLHNKSRLNLITCSGTWNSRDQSYSTRTVIFSELID